MERSQSIKETRLGLKPALEPSVSNFFLVDSKGGVSEKDATALAEKNLLAAGRQTVTHKHDIC